MSLHTQASCQFSLACARRPFPWEAGEGRRKDEQGPAEMKGQDSEGVGATEGKVGKEMSGGGNRKGVLCELAQACGEQRVCVERREGGTWVSFEWKRVRLGAECE